MRVTCPHCGERDRREFTVQGDATALRRPARDASPEAWDAYVHVRDNLGGVIREMWYHDPCQTFVVVARDTATHEVHGATLAREAPR